MLEFCCGWFIQLIEHAGEKGYSVIAYRDGDYRSFYLQARPFERDVIELFSFVDESTGKNKWPQIYDKKGIPVPFVSAISIPLTYCPRCGTDLTKLIREKQREFDVIADKMKEFYNK